jgi:quercetin dioxygenase-like cupin family protein
MQFGEDVNLPEHDHECQWGIVLEGKIELIINSEKNTYVKGDRYFTQVSHPHKITEKRACYFVNHRNTVFY